MKQANTATTNNLAQLLMRRFYWIDESLQRAIRAKGWPPISRAQSLVFVNLGEGVSRPSDIAERIGVTRQAIHQTLAELVSMGLVRLEPDPEDKRAKVVHYTDEGARLGLDALSALQSIERTLAERIGADTLQALKKGLTASWGAIVEPPASQDDRGI